MTRLTLALALLLCAAGLAHSRHLSDVVGCPEGWNTCLKCTAPAKHSKGKAPVRCAEYCPEGQQVTDGVCTDIPTPPEPVVEAEPLRRLLEVVPCPTTEGWNTCAKCTAPKAHSKGKAPVRCAEYCPEGQTVVDGVCTAPVDPVVPDEETAPLRRLFDVVNCPPEWNTCRKCTAPASPKGVPKGKSPVRCAEYCPEGQEAKDGVCVDIPTPPEPVVPDETVVDPLRRLFAAADCPPEWNRWCLKCTAPAKHSKGKAPVRCAEACPEGQQVTDGVCTDIPTPPEPVDPVDPVDLVDPVDPVDPVQP